MQSVFGFHNPDKARAVCYATTASDKSAYRLKIEREAPLFRDVSSWPPDRFIQQIVSDNIHILVNLNGYTRGARNEIFAARPAPIQMSFMGFAGTLGAEWCDYILADTTAIPPDTLRPYRSNIHVEDIFRDETEGATDDWVYSENIIFCRETFFCCDHAQSSDLSERQIDWEQEQSRRWRMRKELFPSLPDDAIILGNFNQLYKVCNPPRLSTAHDGSSNSDRLSLQFSGHGYGSFRKYQRRFYGSSDSQSLEKQIYARLPKCGQVRRLLVGLFSQMWRQKTNIFRGQEFATCSWTRQNVTRIRQRPMCFGQAPRCLPTRGILSRCAHAWQHRS